MNMYPDNIYVKNSEEIRNYRVDINTSLDMFDSKHGIAFDEVARAQYKHWRAIETGAKELMSNRDRDILGL